jgi:hypothetical protein
MSLRKNAVYRERWSLAEYGEASKRDSGCDGKAKLGERWRHGQDLERVLLALRRKNAAPG